MGWQECGSISNRGRGFILFSSLLQSFHTGYGCPQAVWYSVDNIYTYLFPGKNLPLALKVSSLPSGVEAKNLWNYTSAVRRGVQFKHKENFVLKVINLLPYYLILFYVLISWHAYIEILFYLCYVRWIPLSYQLFRTIFRLPYKSFHWRIHNFLLCLVHVYRHVCNYSSLCNVQSVLTVISVNTGVGAVIKGI